MSKRSLLIGHLAVGSLVLGLGCQQGTVGGREGKAALTQTRSAGAPRQNPVKEQQRVVQGSSSGALAMVGEAPVAGREEVIGRAREELGAGIWAEPVAEKFILVGNRGTIESSRGFVERVLTALLNGRFDKSVSRPIAVYLFPEGGSYEAYCHKTWNAACISRYGFFEPSSYKLVMNIGLGIGTLSHEMVHPIMAEDFPGAPTWLNEGIASLFEAPVMPRVGEIHGAKNWRHPRLIAALGAPKERGTTTLTGLFGLSDEAFRGGAEDLHYAMARYFCQWMDQNGKLWDFYHRYRDNVQSDPSGEKAFTQVTGTSLELAQGEWSRWVRGL